MKGNSVSRTTLTIALAALAAAGAMTLGLTATFVHPQVELAKVTASDAASGDIFGHLVSISGDTAVVGANRDDNARGAAYVYVRNGTAWPQQAKLTAFDAAPVDDFGQVSISGDTIVVGAFGDDDTFSASGSAYVFVRSGTTWTLQAKLHAGDAAFNDQFGLTTAISGDTAVVTAPFKDGVGTDSGAAYVFVRDVTGNWTQQAKLTASDAAAGDRFGFVAVSISGDTIVVGASRHDDAGLSSGAAYVFVRDVTNNWTEQAKLTAIDAAAGDAFGFSVSISADTIVLGAVGDDDAGSRSGSAYVFARDVTGNWTQQAKLTASDAAVFDLFGRSVSISGDTVLVGADFDDDGGTNSGSAYVFVRKGTAWPQQSKLTASDAAPGDRFGFFVSNSGDTGIIGAFFDDDAGSNSGSAYLFEVGPADPIHLVNDLIADVIVLNLNTGIQNSLDSKLKAVLNALEDINNNNDQAAIKVLQAFINSVQAQSGKKISVADADALIAAAQAIIDLLC